MSFPPRLEPIQRQLTCCGFNIPKHTEDLCKERKEIVNVLKSIHDPSSQNALDLEKRQTEINDELQQLTLLPGCPCNGECKRYLCSRNNYLSSFNEE